MKVTLRASMSEGELGLFPLGTKLLASFKVFKGGLQQDDLGTRVKRELLGKTALLVAPTPGPF